MELRFWFVLMFNKYMAKKAQQVNVFSKYLIFSEKSFERNFKY